MTDRHKRSRPRFELRLRSAAQLDRWLTAAQKARYTSLSAWLKKVADDASREEETPRPVVSQSKEIDT